MADVKQILVIDDHFEMLEFLRSMLELSNQDCEVLAVPSAEEGLLELRRAHFDLLITDVRLPGMSGFDLVRRVQALGREMPVIMITAYSSSQGRKEAEALGVYRYFQKPLDTDSVLTAVHTALHGESAILPQEQVDDSVISSSLSDDLQRRLEALRVDTGAMHLVLATGDGQVLLSVGDARQLNIGTLMGIVARNVNDSFLLAEELGSSVPFTLQYHAGEKIELYCANVGRTHFLTIFFDAASRRGRIGTIWVFTQRAIKDLLSLLPALETSETAAAPITSPAETASEPQAAPKTAMPPQPPAVPAGDEEPEPDYLDIDPDELQEILATETAKADTGDLEAFWDDALSTESDDSLTSGISLDEALRRGLISNEFEDEETAEN